MSISIILAISVLRYRAEKQTDRQTDRQTNGGKIVPLQLPSAWLTV